MDPDNALRVLRGEQFIDLIPERYRNGMLARRITRLVKGDDGSGHFETIEDPSEVIKLAGRAGAFDLSSEYGVPEKLVEALDITSQLAMAAGLDALREAGIPLVQTYRRTSTGKDLPDRWLLPEALRDETGVIFASAFPGGDRFAEEFSRYYAYQSRCEQLRALEELRPHIADDAGLYELDRRIAEVRQALQNEPYTFDRRFLFRILAMGHSQFAEYIGARGPNTHVNAACASTTQAVGLAEDWIRGGRCRRVVVIAGDNVTSDHLMEWVGAGFLATGAAATDDRVEDAALPFDRRRHGTLLGMGACALVIESEDAVRERGMRGIVELLSSETQNSAFHATRLQVEHIAQVMEDLLTTAERRFGLNRQTMAAQTVFVSHETYTPARGGSAAAEVVALRRTFGEAASEIVMANTKGFTGHAMGVGVEDVIAVKILEHGVVPPVPNFKEVDPELGQLNLSRGGRYPVLYAIHLAAGFGSQIAMSLIRRIAGGPDRVDHRALYQRWLADVSGYDRAETEVVQHILRIIGQGAPPRPPLPSLWQHGTGPALRTPGHAAPAEPFYRPAPLAVMASELAARHVDAVRPASTNGGSRSGNGHDGKLAADEPSTAAAVSPDVPSARLPDVVPATPPEAAPPPSAAETSSTPATTASPAASPAVDQIVAQVLAIVAEKIGYPVEMLDLDLDMEADLGIDTVKQAETFATIRETFSIPRREDLKLRDYPTLARVIEFVHEMRPDLVRAPEPTPATQGEETGGAEIVLPASLSQPAASLHLLPLSAADSVARRVPVPVLRPPLEVCKQTGVELAQGARVIVGEDTGGTAQALVASLGARGMEVLAIEPALTGDALLARASEWLKAGPIQGVYWLRALDVEPDLAGMSPDAWRTANALRVKDLYRLTRALYEPLAASGAFLVAGTCLGGLHGYGAEGATAPLGGAVSGFVKAFKRERPSALVKIVDTLPGALPAEALLAETLRDPGAVEIGYHAGARYSITLEEQPAVDGQPGMTLDQDTVFLVTGAAGGITSAIVADLAGASRGAFYLLDLAPLPEADDPHIVLLRQDRDGLKRRLAAEIAAAGERATPARVEKEIMALERAESALKTVESIRSAGGTATYVSVNLLDGPAVARAVDDLRQRHGKIDVMLHAAGLEISRLLPDKEPAEFERVFDVKAEGFYNVLHAVGEMPIGAVVAFSSIAGRFGNAGQADYSAANDLLCKLVSSFRRTHPATRAIAIDWTAWAEIGMATRGSIPRIIASAGIDMLPPTAGIPTIRRELTCGGTRGEVLVGQRLGVLMDEWDAAGGLNPELMLKHLVEAPRRPMIGKVTSAGLHSGYSVETTLNPQEQPFLAHHKLEGKALLPGVMGLEAFAELGLLLLPSAAQVARLPIRLSDVHFSSPFKFHRGKPRTLYLSGQVKPAMQVGAADAEQWLVHTVLRSVTELPARAQSALPAESEGNAPSQVHTHFEANVALGGAPVEPPGIAFRPPAQADMNIVAEQIYKLYFHGPAYQVLERACVSGDTAVGLLAQGLPPDTAPADADMVLTPRWIELCFQTAGIWEIATKQVVALPASLESVTVYHPVEEVHGRIYALVTARAGGSAFDATVVDEAGRVYVALTGYRTVTLPGQATLVA